MFGRLATEEHDKTYAFIRSHGDRLDPKGPEVGYTCGVRFTATQIASIVGGELLGPDQAVDSVSIDSRSIQSSTEAGALFVPIVAERDGHDFIEAALANGAVCYLTTRPVSSVEVSAIRVDDTMAALTALGTEARNRLPEPVIGVTGSVGKTSVKDLIAAACGAAVPTHANKASFNNELGLPLTLVNAPDETRVTVLEMGARGSGHITDLCAVGRPTIGVVTRVANAHTELFGSLAGVATAKGELVAALPEHGVAVLNADDPLVLAMAERADCRVVTFGTQGGDFRATSIQLDDQLRASFVLECALGTRPVRLAAAGEHMAVNAAAAIAAAVAAGIDLDHAITGVQGAVISSLRMEVTRLAGGLVLINDSYNANPTSMRAALKALRSLSVGERVAILGIMAELGEDGNSEHLRVAQEAHESGIRVIAVAAPNYGPLAEHVPGIEEAKLVLEQTVSGSASKSDPGNKHGSEEDLPGQNGVGILIKGSRVAELERVGRWLVDKVAETSASAEGATKASDLGH